MSGFDFFTALGLAKTDAIAQLRPATGQVRPSTDLCNITAGQRKSKVYPHRQADDFRRRPEIVDRTEFCQACRLWTHFARRHKVFSASSMEIIRTGLLWPCHGEYACSHFCKRPPGSQQNRARLWWRLLSREGLFRNFRWSASHRSRFEQ